MTKSTRVYGSRPSESNVFNVDGYEVDYSHLPENDPDRIAAVVTMFVQQDVKVGSGPWRHHTLAATMTPESAEALAHALIVHAAQARADRDNLIAARAAAGPAVSR